MGGGYSLQSKREMQGFYSLPSEREIWEDDLVYSLRERYGRILEFTF